MHREINNTTHTKDQHLDFPSPPRALSNRKIHQLYTHLPLTGPSAHYQRVRNTAHRAAPSSISSAPCHQPRFLSMGPPPPPLSALPPTKPPTSERLRGLLRRGEEGVVPVPVFGRRHDLAVRSHSWSSRHAYPVAQWCARLHFHLCRACAYAPCVPCAGRCACGPCV